MNRSLLLEKNLVLRSGKNRNRKNIKSIHKLDYRQLAPAARHNVGTLVGYYNYYGVSGNYASLQQFFGEAMQILRKWLNRRSQRKSYSWEGFRQLIEHFQVPRPSIRPRPRIRLAGSPR